MIPDLIIMATSSKTDVIVKGRHISKGVTNLEYSARDSEGELSPTLKLLEINAHDFEISEAVDSLENLIQVKKMLEDL